MFKKARRHAELVFEYFTRASDHYAWFGGHNEYRAALTAAKVAASGVRKVMEERLNQKAIAIGMVGMEARASSDIDASRRMEEIGERYVGLRIEIGRKKWSTRDANEERKILKSVKPEYETALGGRELPDPRVIPGVPEIEGAG